MNACALAGNSMEYNSDLYRRAIQQRFVNIRSGPHARDSGLSFFQDGESVLYTETFPNIKEHVIIEVCEGMHKIHNWTISNLHRYIVNIIEQSVDDGDQAANRAIQYRHCKQILKHSKMVASIELSGPCIMVLIPPISAIIIANSVFLSINEHYRSDATVNSLCKLQDALNKYKNTQSHPKDDPAYDKQRKSIAFEILAIEVIFTNSLEEHYSEIRELESNLIHILSMIENKKSANEIMDRINHLRIPLSVLRDQVESIDKCLNFFLQYESSHIKKLFPHNQTNQQEFECLCQYFDQEVEQMIESISYIQDSIEESVTTITFRMSLTRNKIILVNLIVSTTGFGVSLASALAGIFGMNLKNGFESSNEAFKVITILASTCVLSSFGVGLGLIRYLTA